MDPGEFLSSSTPAFVTLTITITNTITSTASKMPHSSKANLEAYNNGYRTKEEYQHLRLTRIAREAEQLRRRMARAIGAMRPTRQRPARARQEPLRRQPARACALAPAPPSAHAPAPPPALAPAPAPAPVPAPARAPASARTLREAAELALYDGVFWPDLVPVGQQPTQPVRPVPPTNPTKRCSRCRALFARKWHVKSHWAACIKANGNPQALNWDNGL